jgi:predicted transcriptional regulator
LKKEFLDFLNALMAAAPEVAEKLMTDNIRSYIEVLQEAKPDKPEVTENGLKILTYLQENPDFRTWKAKDLADRMGVASRGVSGALRKLVSDGYCEKISADPVVYTITEKGINYRIEGEN